MLASKDTVHKLIPQRPPMVMVDKLLEHSETRTLSGFVIDKDNIFINDGYFTEAGLIENIAQSAALHTGWMAFQKNKGNGVSEPVVGVIGAVKDLRVYQLPEFNTEIQTEIIIQAQIFNATLIRGKVMQEEKIFAECELKIFLQEQADHSL